MTNHPNAEKNQNSQPVSIQGSISDDAPTNKKRAQVECEALVEGISLKKSRPTVDEIQPDPLNESEPEGVVAEETVEKFSKHEALPAPTTSIKNKEELLGLKSTTGANIDHSLLDSIDMTQTSLSEQQVGINKYIKPNLPTFSAILKHRFTDFMVHEVNSSDEIVHLKDINYPSQDKSAETIPVSPKPKVDEALEESTVNTQEQLLEILGEEKLAALQLFVDHGPQKPLLSKNAKAAQKNSQPSKDIDQSTETISTVPSSILSNPIDSKEQRKRFHQTIRQAFKGRLITEHKELEDGTSAIEISWARPNSNNERRPKPIDSNPPYIHFTLQKTNRETQDALSIISRYLHCHVSRDLSICGTKDKRSVSCQRVSLKRGKRKIEDVWVTVNNIRRSQNSRKTVFTQRGDKGIRLGDFTYESAPLKLGDLKGNRFTIVLRDVVPAEPQVLKEAVKTLSAHGFLNYFGMQRFGTTSVGTHLVGLSLLRADWDLAIDLIMRKKVGETQDTELARSVWFDTKDAKNVLNLMPRRCVAERSILQFFSKQAGQTDKCGALASIPKNLKMMYIHAYQSYIWNTVLSRRVELFGSEEPVIGDLVQLDEDDPQETFDDAGSLDSTNDSDAPIKPKKSHAVKVLKTLDDCKAFTIYDVVMPLPGYNIVYPENELGDYYFEIMRRDGLDPKKLYRSQAEYSMGGTYRKILHLPRDVNSQFFEYDDPDLPLTQADEDALIGLELPSLKEWTEESGQQKKNLALKVEFTLGSSAYATMALREILKSDTGKEAQSRMTQRMRERMTNCQASDLEPAQASSRTD